MSVTELLYSILVAMVHVFGIALMAIIAWTASPGSSLFSWHPTMMSIGFAVFMFEAILMFSQHSSLIGSESRKLKVEYHWLAHVFALTFAMTGAAVIIYNKELHGKPHLTTWHGLFGIITIGYAIMQCIAGVSLLYPQSSILNPTGLTLRLLKKFHAISGGLMFNLACGTIILGLFSSWFVSSTNTIIWYICFSLTLMLAAIITNQVADAHLIKK